MTKINAATREEWLVPFGRDTVAEGHKMGWLRHHDKY